MSGSHAASSAPATGASAKRPTPTTRDRIRSVLGAVLLWSSVALLAAMTLLVLYQVFTRYVLGEPAAFTDELVRYALVWLSFIAAAYAFISRGHMSLTILRDRFPGTARRALLIAIDALVLLVVVLVLGVGGAVLAWSSRGDISALLGISRGLVYMIVPISAVAIAIAQILNIIDDVTEPLPATAAEEAEAAAEEAKSAADDENTAPDGENTETERSAR